jgi:hypothetical protein
MLMLAPISTSSFSAALQETDGRAILTLSGNADTFVLARLKSYMQALHTELIDQGFSEVHVDTAKLYFMTSSCLKVLVAWLTSLTEVDVKKRYHVVFLSNPDLHWQRRSFDALRHIADGSVTVRPGSSSVPKVKA